jgi:hypothetical protein
VSALNCWSVYPPARGSKGKGNWRHEHGTQPGEQGNRWHARGTHALGTITRFDVEWHNIIRRLLLGVFGFGRVNRV